MKQFLTAFLFLAVIFTYSQAKANDLTIQNCVAHAYLNAGTNKVDVEFAANVCDSGGDWWGGLAQYFTVRFYPHLDSAPAYPATIGGGIDVPSSFSNYGYWWYYRTHCEDVKHTEHNITWDAGEYNLYCVVDPTGGLSDTVDSNETNNVYGASEWRIGPDLYVSYFWYEVKGAQLKYKFKVCNRGTHKAEKFRVGLYFNRSSAPMDGEYSDTFKSFQKLDPPNCNWQWGWQGSILDCKPSCTEKDMDGNGTMDPIEILRNPTPNDFYQSYLKADSGDFVVEADENNNVSDPIYINMSNPDLVITKFSASVSEISNYLVTYNVEVCNIGTKESGKYWIDLYYHRKRTDPPSQGQPGDVHMGEESLPDGLLPSDSQNPRPANCVTHQFKRYNTPRGEYSSYIQADADDFVVDPDRITNQKGPIVVIVPEGSLPPGCEDLDLDGFGYGSDCAKDPTCVTNCEGDLDCIDGCSVDESKLDCDDDDDTVFPGAAEDCTDDIDQNCNGTANDGCPGVDCIDNDLDGVPGGSDCSPGSNDCDDNDPNRYPGATEICGDNIDNDCDGYADDCCEGVSICDSDDDGACTGTDCPGPRDPDCVAECNGNIVCINSCPPMKDPACVAACEGSTNYEECVNACPDFLDPACVAECDGNQTCIDECPPPQDGDDDNPDCGWAGSIEICGDHIDNDCDGIADDGCLGTYCIDEDNDGFGVGEGCSGQQDCDDTDPDINPGVTEGPVENCGDGIDDNCDWVPDGMCDSCVDTDGDGYWVGNGEACIGLEKDCNDTEAWIHPHGIEICGNDVDENCNLSIEDTPCVDPSDAEECLLLMPDISAVEACLEEHNTSGPPENCIGGDTSPPGPCHDPACILACQSDCEAGINCSLGVEACINSCPIWVVTCEDLDGDGWGTGPGCSMQDCDDTNDQVYPNAPEICNQIDDDCDTTVDDWSSMGGEQCKDPECVLNCAGNANYQDCVDLCPIVDCIDKDGDGWGVGADCTIQDPDDNNPAVYPFAREICGDGVDQDGNNVIDNGCSICKDHDGDGFGVGVGCTILDCDDSNESINPGIEETCGTPDLNCDGKPPVATTCAAEVNGCSCKTPIGSNKKTPVGLPMLLFGIIFTLTIFRKKRIS
jgi:Putative metal-binding motif